MRLGTSRATHDVLSQRFRNRWHALSPTRGVKDAPDTRLGTSRATHGTLSRCVRTQVARVVPNAWRRRRPRKCVLGQAAPPTEGCPVSCPVSCPRPATFVANADPQSEEAALRRARPRDYPNLTFQLTERIPGRRLCRKERPCPCRCCPSGRWRVASSCSDQWSARRSPPDRCCRSS
jgi:hypothetical protein